MRVPSGAAGSCVTVLRCKLLLALLANGFIGDGMPHSRGNDDITKTIFTNQLLKQLEVAMIDTCHSGVGNIIRVYKTA